MSGSSIADQTEQALRELVDKGRVAAGHIVVIGASTSEVVGRRIGTAGAEEIAALIWEGVERVRGEVGFYAAFQCCEHLNRALVVERALLDRAGLEQVAAVPVVGAGGAMAAYAYRRMSRPCLAEAIAAHAGIDIGDTLIGMHIKRVVVPIRPSVRFIGEAHVNMAGTRPPYIGGPRAVYALEQQAAAPDGTCS